MKFSMVFSAIDKASRVMQKIVASEKKMAGAMKSGAAKATRANNTTERSLGAVGRATSKVGRIARRSYQVVSESARKAKRGVKALHNETVALGKHGFQQIGEGSRRAARGVALGSAIMVSAWGGAAYSASQLTNTASEFERFQTILETTEGSSQAAEEAMQWVQNFAVKTPYELDQVTDSFVKLRSYGLDPTKGLLKSLGNTSAAMGKPLTQAVEAMADAVTGENERLKEFGITASKTGDQIKYSYTDAAGVMQQAVVKAGDRMAIQQTLMEIWNEKYGGSMSRLSATWDGMVSNLMDMWIKFQLMIMQSGLFDWMKGKLSSVLETINRMEADGSLQKWAKAIGTSIQTTLENAWRFASGVFDVIQQLTGYLSSAADYVGGWKNLSMILAGIAFAPTLISTAAGLVQIVSGLAALTGALMANPILLAITLIAGGVYLIYKNWDAILPYFQALWTGVETAIATAWDWIKAAFKWTPIGMIVSNWDGIKAALSDPITSAKAAIDLVWAGIKALFKWSPMGLLKSNWAKVSDLLSNPIRLGVDLVKSTWAELKAIFTGNWLPDLSGWNTAFASMKAIDWGALIGEIPGDLWTSVMNFEWANVLPDWDWGNIIPDAPDMGGYFSGDAVDKAFWRAKGRGTMYGDWTEGVQLMEQLQAKTVTADAAMQRLEQEAAGGTWAGRAQKMLDTLKAAQNVDTVQIADPKTLLDASRAATELETKFPKINAAAQASLDAVKGAMSGITSHLNSINYVDQGVALMRTLASGIRQGTVLVTNATRDATQKVRDHLPSSPAKVGPLSDIHRLKFGETIASSINAAPMVNAMRVAAAATMAVAMPVAPNMAVASQMPLITAQSDLPSVAQSEAARAGAGRATSDGERFRAAPTKVVNVNYGDIHIGSATPEARADFAQMLKEHRREIAKLVAEQKALDERTEF